MIAEVFLSFKIADNPDPMLRPMPKPIMYDRAEADRLLNGPEGVYCPRYACRMLRSACERRRAKAMAQGRYVEPELKPCLGCREGMS